MRITRSVALAVSCLLTIAAAAPTGAQETSSAAAIDQYRAAVAMQNRQMYDLAAKEWSTFLQEHGDDPLAVGAKHYLGVCFFQQAKFDKAERSFADVVSDHPDSELIADSTLNLGLSQFNRGQAGDKAAMRRAIKTLAALQQDHRRTPEAKQAPFYLAEAHYALGELDEAIAAYERAVELTPDKKQLAKVLFGYGVALQDQEEPRQARRVFDQLLQLKPPRSIAAEARMRRADTLLASGKLAQAEDEFARLSDNTNSPFADYVQMQLAAARYGRSQYPQAARSYVVVVERFPDSEFASEATVAAGKCFYLAKSYERAQSWLERAVEQRGKAANEAAHWLARTQLAKGDAEAALAIAKTALAKSPQGPFHVELRIDRADALYEIPARRSEASKMYGEIAEGFPQHEQAPHARYMAAYAAVAAEEFEPALRHVAEFVERYHQHELVPDILALAAESKLQMGDPTEAGLVYKQLVRNYSGAPDTDLWRVRAALCANLDDKHQDVIAVLRGRTRQIKDTSLQGEAHFLLGAAYFHKHDQNKAIAELKQSIAVAPEGAQADRAMLLLAKALRETGQTDPAQRVLGDLIRQFPKSKVLDRALLLRAELLAARGDHRQATAAYEQLIESFADSRVTIDAIYGWGWSLIHVEKFAAAKQVFDKLLDVDAKHGRTADCYYARAVALQQLGQADAALRDVDRYLQSEGRQLKDSAMADTQYLRGLCLVTKKEFGDAVSSFQAALRADPEYTDADKVLYEMAWAQQAAKQTEDAAETFQKLARRFPRSDLAAEAIYRAAEADFAAASYQAAARGFADAAQRSEQADAKLQAQCLHKLGWSLYHLGRTEAALEAFQNQLQKFPSQSLAADGQLMLAECLFKQEDFAGAWSAYKQGFDQASTNESLVALALLHAGQSAGQMQQWQASIQRLDQLLQRFPDSTHAPTAQYEKAWALQNSGEVERAEKLFTQVAEATNSVIGAKARFMQGEIQFLRKDYDAAIRTFFKVAYGYGHPKSPSEFHEWQANAIFEAARCCESTKRLDAAQKLYNELIETHPDCDKARDAQRKLEAIAQQ